MSAVTYGHGRVSVAGENTTAGTPRRGWLARVMDRLVQVRMQQAAREVELHLGYLPYSLEDQRNRLVKNGRKDMPSGG